MTATAITAISWNVEHGRAIDQAAAWVRQQEADIYFAQEVQPGQCDLLADLLDMDGYTAAHRPGSTHSTAIFLKRGGPLAHGETHSQQWWAPWHAPANVTVRVRDTDGTLSPRQISCVSGHACYWSSTNRLIEAEWCATLAKPAWLAMHFWDWNSPRAGEDRPWGGYEDRAYVAARTYYEGGERRTDDRPDRQMLAAGYVEMARHAAQHLDQPEAMRPSSGYRKHAGRPDVPPYTIDRGYMSAELAPTLVSYTVCDTPELRRLSDHLPLRAVFSTAKLRSILHRSAGRQEHTWQRPSGQSTAANGTSQAAEA
ncbi:hypothetical protein ABZY93_21950 [Streptomyces smyrnaeus]|uniref:hypothetical protein n=1 Tax=Streptomyces smyrnaeus TaxID=1387713 RepID=UPI0033BBFE06